MSDFVGKFISHYRLEAFLGDGGMGTVYRAYDTNLERQVALKLMHAHYARQPEFQARLSQEARTAAMLDHPSIVRIYDFGESEEGLFIAMEYVSGGSLRSHLTRLQQANKFLPLQQSLQIAAQIAEALDYAHEQGVVHRDVKPGNIILKPLNRPDQPGEQSFRAVLTDFGLVKLVDETSSLTRTGTTMGTPTYMSPEQCEGRSLDGRSDLYSLGVVLYELFTNKLPFQFKSLSDAVATHMRGEMPHPPRAIRTDLPSIIDNILSRLLAKAPGDRYQNGSEVAQALRSAMSAFGEKTTQVIPGGRERFNEDVVGPAADLPQGFRFRIKTPGRESSVAALVRPTITIGRNADNDIVLPSDGVSRYHARAQAARSGWEIVDLGGVNGSWLGERKLQANIPTPIKPGDSVNIGPYQLVLEGPADAEPATVPQFQNIELPTSARSTEPYDRPGQQDPSDAPLQLFLARDTITIEPGRRVELKVEVVNRSPQNDRVNLRVYGVPSDWVQVPDTFVPVPAGGSTPIPIVFQPPRRAETAAGRQRVRIELTSQQFRNLRAAEGFNLILEPFEAFSLEMNPRNLRLPGEVQVTLRNTGNSPSEYSLVGRDPSDHIQFQGERGRIRLVPDQTALVDLQLEPRSQSWFGSYETHGFEIEVASRSGARQTISGNAETAPILPISLGYGALFVIVFFCALAALLVGRTILADRVTPTPTITIAVPLGGPETATALSATQTALAATADLSGDSDGDGLSNALELELGTSPNNTDTDGDGLTDREEVTQYGTTPTKADSDGDTLSDSLEIRSYRTNPNDPDSDGDGIDDNLEIAAGTDPNDPLSPSTATPTITPSTVTVTPSSGNKPDLVVQGDPEITLNYSGCLIPGTSPGTKVTIRNFGTANAGTFVVSVSGIQQTVNGLPVGGGQDVFVQTTLNPVVVVVDVNNSIDESDESNNMYNNSVPLPTPPPTCTPTPSGTPPFTPSNTPETPSPTMETPTIETPSVTPIDTPTYTPTISPTLTLTETGTPTSANSTPIGTAAVPTGAPEVVNPLVNCTTVAPTLDGVLAQNEWGLLPFVEFGPQGGPEYDVVAYFLKDADNYYLAFEIGDPTDNELTDSLRIYFDATNNKGDPDTADRFFQIVRDGTLTIQAGKETNSDSLDWNSDYSSSSWTAVIGEPENDTWLVEMSIAASEIPILTDGNPFRMMSMVLYTGLINPWPANAITDNADTWQEIDNQNCQ